MKIALRVVGFAAITYFARYLLDGKFDAYDVVFVLIFVSVVVNERRNRKR